MLDDRCWMLDFQSSIQHPASSPKEACVVTGGYPVVLTADRTLMADYPVLFDGMMGTIQTTSVPEPIMRNIIAPPLPSDGLAARKAPLGLRRIEAALLNDGFRREDVILCTPEDLDKCVGPKKIGRASCRERGNVT